MYIRINRVTTAAAWMWREDPRIGHPLLWFSVVESLRYASNMVFIQYITVHTAQMCSYFSRLSMPGAHAQIARSFRPRSGRSWAEHEPRPSNSEVLLKISPCPCCTENHSGRTAHRSVRMGEGLQEREMRGRRSRVYETVQLQQVRYPRSGWRAYTKIP
jgi:hypothetical protein